MEQLFLNEKCKFYARTSRGSKAVPVYANIKVNGCRIVVPTDVKVIPDQFNAKKQRALVSNDLSELENRNNAVVNETIKAWRGKFGEYIKWLHNNPDKICDIKEILPNFVPMKKKAAVSTGRKFEETLECIFGRELEMEVKEKRISAHFFDSKQSYLKVFYEFLRIKSIPSVWESLTIRTYRLYSDYLVYERKSRGKSMTIATINNNLSALKAVVTAICERNPEIEPIDTGRWLVVKRQITTSEKKSVNYIFTDEQLDSIIALELSGTAAVVRDLFVFGCYVGQRPADNVRLLKGEGQRFTSNGIDVISILPHKTRKTDKVAFVPIFNTERVDAIIDKFKTLPDYKEYLNKTDSQRNTLNGKYIKQIFAAAGLNDTYETTRQRGNDIVTETKNQSEAAHAYLSRHYFITYMCRNGVPENEVIEMTGHTSTKQIRETYSHLTTEQQAGRLTSSAAVRALAGNNSRKPQENAELQTLLKELKGMLDKKPDHDFVGDYAKEHGLTEMEAAKELYKTLNGCLEL